MLLLSLSIDFPSALTDLDVSFEVIRFISCRRSPINQAAPNFQAPYLAFSQPLG